MIKNYKILLLIFLFLLSGCVGPLDDVGPFGDTSNEGTEENEKDNVSEDNASEDNASNESTGNKSKNYTSSEVTINEDKVILDKLRSDMVVVKGDEFVGELNNESEKLELDENKDYKVFDVRSDNRVKIKQIKRENLTSNENKKIDTEGTAWKVVDKNNPDNYNSIQEAVNDSHYFFTIIVHPGKYKENITVDKNLDIVGLGNAKVYGGNYGFKIESSSPKIKGFEIYDSRAGIIANSDRHKWKIEDTYIHNTHIGIDASNTLGNWEISNVLIKNSSRYGIDVSKISTGWEIKNSRIKRSRVGINGIESGQPNILNNLDLSSNSNSGIRTDLERITNIERVYINDKQKLKGVRVRNFCQKKNCKNNIEPRSYLSQSIQKFLKKSPPDHVNLSEIRNNMIGVEQGSVVTIKNKTSKTINIQKDIKLSGYGSEKTSVSGNSKSQICIKAEPDAKFKIANLDISRCAVAIDAKETNTNWKIENVYMKSNNIGVQTTSSTGSWRINNLTTEFSRVGIQTSESNGNWIVMGSKINRNEIGILNSNSKNGVYRFNRIVDNSKDLSSHNIATDAKLNYWKDGVQVITSSKYTTNNKCSTPSCIDIKTILKK